MTGPLFQYAEVFRTSTLEPNPNGSVIQEVTSGGTPSTAVEGYWGGTIPWLTPKEVCEDKDKMFFSKTERFITQDGLKNSGAKLLPTETVMLTKRAPVGEVAINAVPMANNQGFLSFRCGKDLDPLYLYFWFKANKPYLEVVANGSTYPELYVGDLFEFVIGYPSIEEQKRVVKLLLSLSLAISLGSALESTSAEARLIDAIHRDTSFLENLKQRLMLNLISGRLTVNDLVEHVE